MDRVRAAVIITMGVAITVGFLLGKIDQAAFMTIATVIVLYPFDKKPV
jgi:hypothetical protein